MTTEEFSNKFDTLANSFSRTILHGEEHSRYDLAFDEYEKSVFLTNAQRELVISLYSGRNAAGIAFEEKEELREALDSLVKTVSPEKITENPSETENLYGGGKTFTFFAIPDNLLYIIFEEVKFSSYLSGCLKEATALVVPATHDDLWHRVHNPFRGPSKNRVLRINASDNVVELVSDYPIGSYLLRYVEEPQPIILTDLREELAIQGKNTRTECQLPSITHQTILENAVRRALQTRGIGFEKQS